ncbi:MAG TPA: hypothetical protein VIZ00_11980 [Streptosporangiaceae bacterium]
MAAELARQDNPSPEQLFSTLEEVTMLDDTLVLPVPARLRPVRHPRG